MKITHINPDTLFNNPAFSQAVKVTGQSGMLYIGGQNGVMADGSLAGNDIAAQTEQALKNIVAVLETAGATQEDVIKLNVHIVQEQDIRAIFAASQKVWGMHPTAITVLLVAGLARPDALVEIDAVCALKA